MANRQLNVLILLFKHFNTLDVNGPLEVLCNYSLRQNRFGEPQWCPFNILIASKDKQPVQGFEFVHTVASIDYKEAREKIANDEIDVFITPGFAGPNDVTKEMIDNKDETFDVIKEFFESESKKDRTINKKWMISICVGALLNAHVGVFDGREATTHFAAISSGDLKKYSNNKALVIRKRWVDGGETKSGIRIVSSGGISCGIDCMLWFISQTLGMSAAQGVAHMMDYVWNGGPPQAPGKQPTIQWY